MDKVPSLLKSKRFWSALLGTLVIVISAFEPTLSQKFEQIVPAVIIVVGFLIGGFTAEDVTAAAKQ